MTATLLTVADVARICALGETAARDLLRAAGGFKLGGVWRLWPADLDRHMAAQRAKAATERESAWASGAPPLLRSPPAMSGSTAAR